MIAANSQALDHGTGSERQCYRSGQSEEVNGLRAGGLQHRSSMHADGAGQPSARADGNITSRYPALILQRMNRVWVYPRADLLPCQPPEQKPTKYDEQNVRKPDEQFGVRVGISTQRIADDNKEKISGGDDQTHGKPD